MESFAALADPTRRRIIEILARGPLPAGAIAQRFAITAPAISQHLKVLRAARLVQVRVAAQQRIYELDAAGFAEIDDWLEGVEPVWQKRLDALERQRRLAQRSERRES